jgi:hypothetical protein
MRSGMALTTPLAARRTMVRAMATSLCPQCHNPLADSSRFCGQCGTLTPLGKSERPPSSTSSAGPDSSAPVDLSKTVVDPVPAGLKGAQRTMMGYALSDEQLAAAQRARAASAGVGPAPGSGPGQPQSAAPETPVVSPATGAAPPSTSAPPVASVKRTMVGIPVGDVLGGPPPSSVVASTVPQQGPDPRKGTMMGVAIPGIAPLAASAPPSQNIKGTMMGVAIPGIAPTVSDPIPAGPAAGSARPYPMTPASHFQPRRAVEIAPMPPPLVDDEPDVGPAPQLVKRGQPLAWVAGILGALVAIGGPLVLIFMSRSPPLVAQPKLDAQGHEALHLVCESCQDGTTAELYETRATFKNKEADLALASPLKVGNNPLTIVLDRPKLGRDESVQVIVPVAFRIRADLADLTAAHPAITVRVEALSGTTVKVDAKPVALDAAGDGVYSVDIGSETDGPADELRMIDRVIPYAITPPTGDAQVGKLSVRVGIAPLLLDAPGLHAVVEGGSFRVAGQTVKGGTITVNGSPVKMEADGTFAQPFDIPALGELPVELRSSAPQLAPRTAHFVVKRVDHLADEAKAREAQPAAGYDDIMADIKAAVGKSTIVEGDVFNVQTTSVQTVVTVDDSRGCAHAPCLVRVTYGGDARFKHGDTVRAYGRVTRPFLPKGSTSPVAEVEADFVQMGHAPKR